MDSFSNLVNENTLNLYNAATSGMPAGNLMLSPFSILYASMLMYLGANGTTKANLDNAVLFKKLYNADKAAALTDFSNAMTRIKSVQNESDPSHYMIVSVNNAVFVDQRVKLKPSYVVAATEKLHAVAENKDLAGNPDHSRQEINTWVAEKTGGLIKELLSSGAVDSTTKAVLVNTVFYNASWARPFNPEETWQEEFTNIDGTKVFVEMMKKEDWIRIARAEQLHAYYVELDYYNQETSMLILLPDRVDGLRDLEKNLTVSILAGLKNRTTSARVKLGLPKFTTESQFDLVELLKKIGVEGVFTRSADFSDMANSGLSFNNGVHKTYISVDEQGTVAAAASAFSKFRSIPMSLDVNHPFFYAIRHNPTDTLLFVGRVEKLDSVED